MNTIIKISRTLFFITIAFLVLQPNSFGQVKAKEVNTQSQSWFSINNTIRLHKKWGAVADFHVRRNNFMANPGFYFARAGVNYWLKDNLTLTLGYAQLWAAPSNPDWHHFVKEKRIYQQVQLVTKIGKVGLLNRLRNEQRWQERIVNDQPIHSNKFSDRIRYLLSINIPIFKNPHYPSLVVADEIAIQFGKEIIYNTFDQNRTFIGIKQPVTKHLSFDAGYMLLYQQKASGYQYDKNHTFRLFFYYTPDFRKKK